MKRTLSFLLLPVLTGVVLAQDAEAVKEEPQPVRKQPKMVYSSGGGARGTGKTLRKGQKTGSVVITVQHDEQSKLGENP